MDDPALYNTFLDLHNKLGKKGLNIILGGGYGLYLKQLALMSESGARTLLPVESWPRPRSTSDLDLFFPLQLLISLEEMQAVRATIDEMKFKPVTGSEYWSFLLPENRVKIDLLTGPIDEGVKDKLKSDSRRARPKGDLELHAHPVPEALGLSEYLEQIPLAGNLPDGKQYSALVNIPSPFTYLMMKVTTFGDQLANADKDQGRHHALDVYRIIAMISENLFEQAKQQFQKYSASMYVTRVKELSKEYFGEPGATGILRMKEHAFFGENMQVNSFIEILRELILV
jgi:hypothetical protein